MSLDEYVPYTSGYEFKNDILFTIDSLVGYETS